MKKWKIFVIFHKTLINENYTCDPTFEHDNFSFIECNEKITTSYDESFGYDVIEEKDLEFYNKSLQERVYMAPSAIYHAYKNGLHEEYDYIGFLEYDIPLISMKEDIKNITHTINDMVQSNDKLIVPLSYKHTISRFISQRDITINKQNCMDVITKDYNAFMGTDHKIKDHSSSFITSQQSFLTDKNTFENVMKFISHVVENKYAERPNSWKRPSTLMDRYIGTTLHYQHVEGIPLESVYLEHSNLHLW